MKHQNVELQKMQEEVSECAMKVGKRPPYYLTYINKQKEMTSKQSRGNKS